MNKNNPRFLLSLVLLVATACASALAPAADAVTVLSWEAFISPKVLKSFKNRESLDVTVIEFTTPEQRDALLRQKQGQIDIVIADTLWNSEYKRRGIIEKLDAKKIPTLKHSMTRWRTDAEYAVPYLWGHTGIAWRTDLVKDPLASYADLFKLASANPGKVSLLDDSYEALRAALFAFGAAPYRMRTPVEVKAANSLLQPHLKNVRLVGSELGDDSPWVTGQVIAGQAYNGDIAYLRDTYKVPLAFAVPSPGCLIFQEQLMLLKSAKNKEAAYRFLTLINDPKYAARNATDVRYATANALAVPELSEQFRKDAIIRPTFEGLENCEFSTAPDAATQSAIDKVKIGR